MQRLSNFGRFRNELLRQALEFSKLSRQILDALPHSEASIFFLGQEDKRLVHGRGAYLQLTRMYVGCRLPDCAAGIFNCSAV